MSEQPNEEERQEVAVPEPDGEDDNAAIASLVSSIVLILAFIAAWAGATGHYTTLLIAVALGIASVTISTYFGWPPNKVARSTGDLIDKVVTALLSAAPKSPLVEADTEAQPIPFEVEHDRLAKEVVHLRLKNERLEQERRSAETTKLEHNAPTDETIRLPENPPPPKDEALDPNVIVNPAERWTEYTEDVFENIIWRWHYKAHIDNTPRDIKPFCIECERDTPLEYVEAETENETLFFIVRCRTAHFPQLMIQGPWHAFKSKIKDKILEKLNKGTWVEVVNRQRALKQLPPIAVPVDVMPPNLNEVPIQILIGLRFEGGECDEPHLYSFLDFVLTGDGEPDFSRVAFKYHLQDLEQKGFIRMTHDPELNTITLTQAGRKYVLDNKL